jgi:hypothetical protein
MRYEQLTKRDKRGARAFRRVFADRTAAWDEAENADAGFDGGEWSGLAWARTWERQAEDTAEFIAGKFALDVNRLLEAVFILENIEGERYWDHVTR